MLNNVHVILRNLLINSCNMLCTDVQDVINTIKGLISIRTTS